MCSQPIVQDAQPERATRRISARPVGAVASLAWLPCVAPRRSAPSNVADWKLRVGSAEIALKVSRLARVPSSRYLAVAGPNDRSRRSRAAASTCVGSAALTLVAARTAIALRFLAPMPAPARVPAVVRDRRVADTALARRADGRDPPAPAQLVTELAVRVRRGQAG